MNRVLLALILSFSASPSYAFTAMCDGVGEEVAYFGGASHLGVYSDIDLDCRLLGKGEDQYVSFNLETYGPGLQNFIGTGVIIECPLVSKKRLNKILKKKGKWSVGGVGASAGFILGARGGAAINERGAVCTITGLGLIDFGATAGFIKLTAENYDY